MRPAGLPPRPTTALATRQGSALDPAGVGASPRELMAGLLAAAAAYAPGGAAGGAAGRFSPLSSNNNLTAILQRTATAAELAAQRLEIIRGQFGTALTQLDKIASHKGGGAAGEAEEAGGMFGKLGQLVAGFKFTFNAVAGLPAAIRGAVGQLAAASGSQARETHGRVESIYQDRLGQTTAPAAAALDASLLTLSDQLRGPTAKAARAMADTLAKDVIPGLQKMHEGLGDKAVAGLMVENPGGLALAIGAALKNGVPPAPPAAAGGEAPTRPGPAGTGGHFRGANLGGAAGDMIRRAGPAEGGAATAPPAAAADEAAFRRDLHNRVEAELAQGVAAAAHRGAVGAIPAVPAVPAPPAAPAPQLGRLVQAPPAAGRPDWAERYVQNLELLARHNQHQTNMRFGGPATQGDLGDLKRQMQLRVLNADPLDAKHVQIQQENNRVLHELVAAVREQTRRQRPAVAQ